MQTGVKKLPRAAGIVLPCLFLVFVSVSCRRTADIAGKYYDVDKSHESLELNPDGTFYRSLASGGGVTGTYVVNKNEITLKMRVRGTDMGSKGEILESDKGVRVTIMEPNAFGSGEVARSFFRPSAAEEARGRKAAEAALEKVIAPLNLMPSPEFPLAGFWKKNCADPFGLAISTAVDKRYTVSFCGPGGCSELRKTTITNDSYFRSIEKDSIEMKWGERVHAMGALSLKSGCRASLLGLVAQLSPRSLTPIEGFGAPLFFSEEGPDAEAF